MKDLFKIILVTGLHQREMEMVMETLFSRRNEGNQIDFANLTDDFEILEKVRYYDNDGRPAKPGVITINTVYDICLYLEHSSICKWNIREFINMTQWWIYGMACTIRRFAVNDIPANQFCENIQLYRGDEE